MTQQTFGGSWTKIKLELVQKYLSAYTTALKNQPFDLWYIDGFAGTGSFETKPNKQLAFEGLNLLGSDVDRETCTDGSAKIALQLKNPFSRYVFIEKDPKRFAELQKLKEDFPEMADRMAFHNEDANSYIADLCKEVDWKENRGVMFLDPFGLQVDWETIARIASTKAIDLWFLFPISAVNRMLPAGGISPSWEKKLNKVFGASDWHEAFYTTNKVHSLLEGEKEITKKTCNFDTIRDYIISRLNDVFTGVADDSPMLCTPSGHPLFLLCFAVGNERGKTVALNIAKGIIKKWR